MLDRRVVQKFLNEEFKDMEIEKPSDISEDTLVETFQTSNTNIWHYRARKYNFYLRGFKYLLIMQKENRQK